MKTHKRPAPVWIFPGLWFIIVFLPHIARRKNRLGEYVPVEIELKVWLDDHEAVRERLSSLGGYVRSYEKSDSYWFPIQEGVSGVSIPTSGLRVRRERGVDANHVKSESVLVTVKKKRLSGKLEVNEEREFSVSDADLFEELAADLGLFKSLYKKKSGWEWRIPAEIGPVCAEISMVKGLGWFLELEILGDDAGEGAVAECRRVLLSILKELRLSEDKIETRSYTALLRNRWNNA